MYITNNPAVARIADDAGVDGIFVDMEYIGKTKRQSAMDTVQNHHSVDDVKKIKTVVNKAKVIVRVNPIHDENEEYCSSETEIEEVIEAGADWIMLPYFQSVEEVHRFIDIVDGRVGTLPLLESKMALKNVDEILKIPGIDRIHIGLNDLSLDLKKKFMFELLTDGTVEYLCNKFSAYGVTYGFGGIGRIGYGDIPAEYIIKEHYRLGSSCAILSRSFCNTSVIEDYNEVKKIFFDGVEEIRTLEKECEKQNESYFYENRVNLQKCMEKFMRKYK